MAKTKKSLLTVLLAAVLTMMLASTGLCSLGCSSSSNGDSKPDFSGVRKVAELSTLKAYYHNVAEADQGAYDNILGFLFKLGYKRVWIEYTGTVDIGIDANKVNIESPDSQGIVKVHIPDVQILGINLDRDSIGDPITENGLFSDLTGEEKMAAFTAAQKNMQEQASQDQLLFVQANDRVRFLIKGYVENVGAARGETYTVEWV